MREAGLAEERMAGLPGSYWERKGKEREERINWMAKFNIWSAPSCRCGSKGRGGEYCLGICTERKIYTLLNE
jgi:hypothetical protein